MRRTSSRLRSWILTAILGSGLLLLAIPSHARQAALGMEASEERFYCEEILEVSLMVGAVSDLRGFHVELGFDPAVISAFEVLPGSMLGGASCGSVVEWLNPIPGADQLIIDVGLLGCSVNGGGELLKLRFTGVANGTSPLTVDGAILRDSINQTIPWVGVDDSVDYRCPRPGTLTFVPPDGSFGCNQTLVVEVHVDEYTLDLHGTSLEIDFDENVVVPVSVAAGSLVSGAACPFYLEWLNPTPGEGTLQLDVANLGCSIDGPGAVLEITFQGVLQGTSPLECISLTLRDSQNQDIEADCVPASIEYRCPVPVEEAGWGMLKARFSG